ncbi:MAG: arginine repressor [Acidobacteria bacterium]|nr:arginine repressor [Acidobacteriota bacterium]
MSVDRVLLEIVDGQDCENQQQLVRALRSRGIRITQSTLSRHLSKLGIRKEAGVYVRTDQSMLRSPVIAIHEAPPNLLVIKTPPGHAQPIAYRLDESTMRGVVGTVGGDDTVIVVVSPPESLSAVRREIMAMIATS